MSLLGQGVLGKRSCRVRWGSARFTWPLICVGSGNPPHRRDSGATLENEVWLCHY
jgi:hypothetical protein